MNVLTTTELQLFVSWKILIPCRPLFAALSLLLLTPVPTAAAAAWLNLQYHPMERFPQLLMVQTYITATPVRLPSCPVHIP
jgi:hypothetical protein